MCLLIVLRGASADHPIVVAANRDERIDRAASPPGLFVGRRHRQLSPRDRLAGGTWLAVDERCRFAGITNIAGTALMPEAPSRGHLPHLALDQPDIDSAVTAVRQHVGATPHAAFQLVVCDGRRTIVVRHKAGAFDVVEWSPSLLVVTNEHPPGVLELRGVAGATAAGIDLTRRLDLLQGLLKDRGLGGGHVVCKRGDTYGTVSSSVLAIPARDPLQLVWRYAPGPPDVTPYRSYGNLGRRLLPDDPI